MTELIICCVGASTQDGEIAQVDPGAPTRFGGRSLVSSAHVEPAQVRAVGADAGAVVWDLSLHGYSRDGETAVVAVSIAFDQHGSGENFALRLSTGKWQVVWSDLHITE